MPTVNFTGLASGLDTRALIDAILNFERQPIERLENRQQLFNQRRAALDELRSKLNTFENALRDLTSARTFRGRSATVSDETILRATPGSGSETGLFSVEVNGLAAAHRVRSEALISPDQGLVADGTITLQSGSNDPITIDVSAANGNNTLQAVRDAINSADAGVRAAIIFDGADYILSVRAEKSGTANALSITDSTNLNLDDAGNLVTAAADAQLIVDGIAVTSSSNKVANVISGVTLDLLSETGGTPITVEVAQDVDGVVSATQTLVSEYNSLIEFFNTQNSRDNPGPLSGDATARSIQSRIQRLFTGGVDGIPIGGIRALSSVGVSFDGRTGKASLDTSALRELLETRFAEVGDLFLSSGRPTDPRIQYLSGSSVTQPGVYAVEVTQAAEQASVVGGTVVGTLAQNESLTISVGGENAVIDLTAGQGLAEIITAINTALRDAGVSATAADDAGRLRISSRDFGSAVELTVSSDGDGSGSGFSTTASTDSGLDVTGKIGGVDATGVGQVLTGANDEAFSGLSLKVTASPADVISTGGDFGTVSYSGGLVNALIARVDLITQFGDGELDVAREGLERSVKQIVRDIERFEHKLALREAQLLRSFAAAERAISLLQAQQAQIGGGLLG